MRVHVSLPTRDLEAAEAFYTALFGVGPDKRRADYCRFAPADVPIVLSLMPGDPRAGTLADHFGVRFSEVEHTRKAWERVSAAGLNPRLEEGVNCCWAIQNKAWVTDPDGRDWELYTVVDDSPADSQLEKVSCCA